MTIGVVKWFNTDKGYGFIGPDGGERDVFVHITAVQKACLRTLAQGQTVSFDVEMRSDRVAAINLGSARTPVKGDAAGIASGLPGG